MRNNTLRIYGFSIGLLFVSAMSIGASTYYVSGSGSDSKDGSTEALAFRNLSKAAGVVNAGDTVWMMGGTYSSFTISRSGTAQGWIVWKKKPGATPELKFNGWNAVTIAASYQVMDGLTVTGNNDNVVLAAAEADYDATGPGSGLYNGNGIGTNDQHHVAVRNCIIRKCGGAGLHTGTSDYLIFEDNQVYENAWYSRYANSGISINTSQNIDQEAGYHVIVQRNRVWNNRGLVKWKQTGDYSDGNGIIIDQNKIHNFTGKTLVCNNVSFNNGGSGIHSFKSQNVDIFNNTTYYNGQKVGYGCCFAGISTNVRIFNNIMYAAPNLPPNENYGNTNVTYDYNIYYGGTAAVVPGTHSLTVNPGLVNPSRNPDSAEFRLISTSNAKNVGTTLSEVTKDILGVTRPQGSAYDIGAYEYVASTGIGAMPQHTLSDQSHKSGFKALNFTGRLLNNSGIWIDAQGNQVHSIATLKPASGVYFFHGEIKP